MTVALVAALAGCAGELDLSPDAGWPPPEGLTIPPPAPPPAGTGGTCDALKVFADAGCKACHDKTGSNGGFDMETTAWETHLVGVAPKGGGSTLPSKCAGGGRVYLTAGSKPATGLFLDKLKAKTDALCGDRMPTLGDYLTTAQLDCVQQWANALTSP